MNMITRIQHDAGTPSDIPTREEAEAAFRTIIRWAGDDPDRDGLAKTPARLARAFKEYFSGYALDPAQMLSTTFEETNGYDEMIVLRGIGAKLRCGWDAGSGERRPASLQHDGTIGSSRACQPSKTARHNAELFYARWFNQQQEIWIF